MAASSWPSIFRGLNTAETTALTLAMRDSGDILKFPKDKRPLVDSIPPAASVTKFRSRSRRSRVPRLPRPDDSGRGLSITGGTLDKLDSIPTSRRCCLRRKSLRKSSKSAASSVARR